MDMSPKLRLFIRILVVVPAAVAWVMVLVFGSALSQPEQNTRSVEFVRPLTRRSSCPATAQSNRPMVQFCIEPGAPSHPVSGPAAERRCVRRPYGRIQTGYRTNRYS
jgi:hypothetical protein